jgi:hypothetical protein
MVRKCIQRVMSTEQSIARTSQYTLLHNEYLPSYHALLSAASVFLLKIMLRRRLLMIIWKAEIYCGKLIRIEQECSSSSQR